MESALVPILLQELVLSLRFLFTSLFRMFQILLHTLFLG
jgi:hypothetical protein